MSESAQEGVTPRVIVLPRELEPLVSILIPTTSQAQLLLCCLRSLERNLGDSIPVEVIIVMNAATNEVRRVLEEQVSGAIVVDSPANLGVAGGNNRGRSVARGQFMALIHDDVEIMPLWLESLVETMVERPEAGAVASQVYFPDGKLQSAGAILWKNALTSPSWGSGEPRLRNRVTVYPVDYSGTCSILVRTRTWDAIGGLDQRLYPAYYVDVDLCMSIRRYGQIVLCNLDSKLIHHRSASSKVGFRSLIATRNRAIFSEKWKSELERYESCGPDETEALNRAQAHTERLARELSEMWEGSKVPDVEQDQLSVVSQDLLHLTTEREILRDYIAQLDSKIDCQESSFASLRNAHELLVSANSSLRSALEAMRGVAKDYYETLAVRERELSDQRTAKERLKERCVRMREKIENLQAKMKRNQKPSKWHQRFIRRLKGTWRSD